jgi:hypothetical protein
MMLINTKLSLMLHIISSSSSSSSSSSACNEVRPINDLFRLHDFIRLVASLMAVIREVECPRVVLGIVLHPADVIKPLVLIMC